MGQNVRKTSVAAALGMWASLLLLAGAASAQPLWVAPAQPAVRPHLPARADFDLDNNRVDDRIDRSVGQIRRQLALETNQARRQQLAARLAQPIAIELVFRDQVTQQQIDDFLAMGGRIGHLYRAVSYGWSGTLPAASVDALATAMGSSLLVVAEEAPAQLHMDEATRTGRIRPIWAGGFGGQANGLSGTSDITIGIVDSGVDDSHTDLNGRLAYWKDSSGDNEANPRDVGQHGSHVAGIALGSGASFGVGPGTLRYTDSGDMTGVAANAFFIAPAHLPAATVTVTENSTWLGGSTTILRLAARANGVGGGFIAINTSPTSASGVTLSTTTLGNPSQNYSSALAQNSTKSLTRYATTVSVTSYPAVGDGFNAMRGVAPGARWAGAKVFTNAGAGSTTTIGAGLDDLVAQRTTHNIKVVNMSLGVVGSPGLDAGLRAKSNTMVSNGIVVVASAGNDGPGSAVSNQVDDPGRASLVLTVGAVNEVNALTHYSSSGFPSPSADEDMKPDVLAPGGSDYYSHIMSVDSNDADAESSSFADRVANDYYNIKGTSMAAPFVAGSAALVIDAMQKAGTTWSFSSSTQPLFVKMMLCASSTETNVNREVNFGSNPTLGRAAAPKDIFEGYGIMNPDAAAEAIGVSYTGGTLGASSAGTTYDRRAWGRKLGITSGPAVALTLTNSATADYDLYLYSGTPDSKGNPVIVASSTNAGLGMTETLNFTPTSTETRYLFIKRVSGSGDWSLSSGTASGSCGDGIKQGSEECDDGNQAGGDCCSSTCKLEANGSTCSDGLFCTQNDTCSAGVCSGGGNPCTAQGECNNVCNEAADSCAVASGTTCTSDANPCTIDRCNGAGACTHPAGNAGTQCRASGGTCDVAENCDGTNASCPNDGFVPSTTTCRIANGACDTAEKCTGSTASCPADTFAASTTVCRSAATTCDVAETCTGSSGACPNDEFASSQTVCRASAGACDVQESCTGSSTSCPSDGFVSGGTMCRASTGICDVQEVCSGSGAACPTDVLAGSSTVCRSSVDVCDAAETCTGSSGACPDDAFASSQTVCRSANGLCDAAEKCTGSGSSCPADAFANAGSVCRPVNGNCDAAETCTGSSGACPNDGFASSQTVCRASAGACDVQENCTGSGATCPNDVFVAPSVCRPVNGNCDAAESCSGSGAACPTDVFAGSSTVCRSSVDVCDAAETCTGNTGACPADAFAASQTVCRSASGACDVAENCTGTTNACPVDSVATAATSCRASTGECDIAENCNGTSKSCPTDLFVGNNTGCSNDGNTCTSDICNGVSGACQHPANTAACDDGLFCNGADTCAAGACTQHVGAPCPGPDGDNNCAESCNEASDSCTSADSNGTPCDDGLFCNGADTCSGGVCSGHVGSPCPGADGDANCAESCNEASDTCTAPDSNGSPCKDGLFCTATDTCSNGVCGGSGTPCPGADGDGNCAESCNEAADTCTAADANGSACNDGLFCTVTDTCSAGVCGGAGTPCAGADGDANCSETCNEAADNCAAADPNGSVCNDGLFCNGADTCQAGACSQHLASPCAGADGDGNCAESCDEAADNCAAADPNGSACSDGLACTTGETCLLGSCVVALNRCGVCGDGSVDQGEACDDGNTANGDCCSSTCTLVANGTSCNDGVFCNGADTCSAGLCSVNAGNPCTGPDGDANCSETCNEAADTCTAADPNGSVCDDGVFCNGADTCQAGACSQHVGSPCSGADGDGNCSESCNENAKNCGSADPNGSVCDDGVFCNGADTCASGACSQHVGSPCAGPDADANCLESCNENAKNCVGADPNGSVCNDGLFCNGADSCSGGECSQHGQAPCAGADSDGDCAESCDETTDACNAVDPDGSTCNDASFCNGADTCKKGECSQHAGDPCSGADGDGNCAESCDEGPDACTASDVNGSVCDDGEICTIQDVCTDGVCLGAASPKPECAVSTTTTTLPAVLCGDISGDGKVTASDALAVLQRAVSGAFCPPSACDFNGDGRVTAPDAQGTLKSAVGQAVTPKCPNTEAALQFVVSTTVTSTTLLPMP